MSESALERIRAALEVHGSKITPQARGVMAQCPAHEDRNPSLSVTATESRARVRCFAGCPDEAVLEALGLTVKDLYDSPRGRDLARYVYTDALGASTRTVHRREGKRFRQSGDLSTPTLYHLPQVVAAVAAGQEVYLVEGEEDVHAVVAAGAVATTAPQGAGSFVKVDVAPLTGARVVVVPDQDEAGVKWLAAVRQRLAGVVEHLEVRAPLEGKDVDDHLARGHGLDALTLVEADALPVVEALPPGAHGGLVALSTITPERVSWLWPARLPRGKLVVIDGDPSVGKSTLTIDLAARTTTGAPWPDGAVGCAPAGVLLLSAEDGLADTIAPRLVAAGADLTKVHALVTVALAGGDDGKVVQASPSLPRDVPHLETIVTEHGVALVVVDVLMAYLNGKVDAHRDQDVRSVLHQLAAMAERTGCCVLLLRHLNKAAGASPLYRGGGSIGIVGAARAAYLVARDPEDPERRILAVTKLNIAHEPPALAYRLVDAPEHGCARIQWEDGPTTHTATELLAGPSTEEEREERDEVVTWLRHYLTDSGGETKARDVYREGKAQGYTQDMLKRAKRKAHVTSAKGTGQDAGWLWKLDLSDDQDDDPEREGSDGPSLLVTPARREEQGTSDPAQPPPGPLGLVPETPLDGADQWGANTPTDGHPEGLTCEQCDGPLSRDRAAYGYPLCLTCAVAS